MKLFRRRDDDVVSRMTEEYDAQAPAMAQRVERPPWLGKSPTPYDSRRSRQAAWLVRSHQQAEGFAADWAAGTNFVHTTSTITHHPVSYGTNDSLTYSP